MTRVTRHKGMLHADRVLGPSNALSRYKNVALSAFRFDICQRRMRNSIWCLVSVAPSLIFLTMVAAENQNYEPLKQARSLSTDEILKLEQEVEKINSQRMQILANSNANDEITGITVLIEDSYAQGNYLAAEMLTEKLDELLASAASNGDMCDNSSQAPMSGTNLPVWGVVEPPAEVLALKKEAEAARILSRTSYNNVYDPTITITQRLYRVAIRAISDHPTPFDGIWVDQWDYWWSTSHAMIPGDTRTPAERFYAYAAGRVLAKIPDTPEILDFENHFHQSIMEMVKAKNFAT